jgi:hypothetical protein
MDGIENYWGAMSVLPIGAHDQEPAGWRGSVAGLYFGRTDKRSDKSEVFSSGRRRTESLRSRWKDQRDAT